MASRSRPWHGGKGPIVTDRMPPSRWIAVGIALVIISIIAALLTPWWWLIFVSLIPILGRYLPYPFEKPTPEDEPFPGGGPTSPQWRAIKASILKQDKFRCVNCGKTDDLDVVHIVPIRKGGSHKPSNLITLCAPCRRNGPSPGGTGAPTFRRVR